MAEIPQREKYRRPPWYLYLPGCCYCVRRVVVEARSADGQPLYRDVLPEVAVRIIALMTVTAGGRTLNDIINCFNRHVASLLECDDEELFSTLSIRYLIRIRNVFPQTNLRFPVLFSSLDVQGQGASILPFPMHVPTQDLSLIHI